MAYLELPHPFKSDFSLDEAILRRRSVRQFDDFPLTIQQLSNLLWAGSGITGCLPGAKLRAAPSAGATYPIEVYVLVNGITGISNGIYHYLAKMHHIELRNHASAKDIVGFALRQKFILRASVTFILTAVPSRTIRRYGNRAFRYIHLEAGHIAQNIMLESVALGLVSVPVGAFDDDKLNKFLGFAKKEEIVVYLVSAGFSSEERKF